MLDRAQDWRRYLHTGDADELIVTMQNHSRTGHPSGDDDFIKTLETLTNRRMKKLNPSPGRGIKLTVTDPLHRVVNATLVIIDNSIVHPTVDPWIWSEQ